MVVVSPPSSRGCGHATGSLVKGGVRGLFSSAGAFTGFVNRTLAHASLDKSVVASQSASSKQKPKHALDGVSRGLATFGKGIVGGVTGLVTRPVEGVMKDGAKGLVTGLAQGMVGVVVSPLMGVSGGLTKLFEGVSNTTRLFEVGSRGRVRPYGRAFYGSGRVLKRYSPEDAFIASVLKHVDHGRVSGVFGCVLLNAVMI